MPLGGSTAERGSYSLFRVDDRLLHGQVALAWGRQLNPKHYLLADLALSADPETAELYVLSAPEGCDVAVFSPEQLLDPATHLPPPRETILLVRDLAAAALLLRGGVPGPVNLGGIHVRQGARQIFPFLFLTPDEENLLAALLHEGHAIFAQDLPQNPKREAAQWLRADSGAARGE